MAKIQPKDIENNKKVKVSDSKQINDSVDTSQLENLDQSKKRKPSKTQHNNIELDLVKSKEKQ